MDHGLWLLVYGWRLLYGGCKEKPLINISSIRGLRGVGRDRTADTRIFSPLLYRLSYRTFAKAPVRRRTKTFFMNGLQTMSFGPARCSLGESGQQK